MLADLGVLRMKTTLCTRVGIEVPIIQAPMGNAVGPALASAVSNAGGLGMLALWRADAETMRKQIGRPGRLHLNRLALI
jgi:NAD(P)H-dependent flavin oxidoreductase YrpB (nitropropane dioxygenase family)